jgi:hypothetical protein
MPILAFIEKGRDKKLWESRKQSSITAISEISLK